MSVSKYDLLQDLRGKYGMRPPRGAAADTVETYLSPQSQPERAFVVETNGKTVLTAPVREIAAVNQGFTYLRGRFVGADEPNRNGAMWSTADLELGAATVAGGPLNWIHDEMNIVGCLMDGNLVGAKEAAADGQSIGAHIVSTAALWRFLFPQQASVVEKAAADGDLYYSMECVSSEVACVDLPGRPGCGMKVPYVEYDQKSPGICSHLRERSSVRQFVDPIFLGGAIIVPPVKPGWAHANVEVVRQAAALAEEQGLSDGHLSVQAAVDLATGVLAWANRAA